MNGLALLLRKVARDLRQAPGRALAIVLALALSTAAVVALRHGGARLDEAMRDNYLATQPAHAQLMLDRADPALASALAAQPGVQAARLGLQWRTRVRRDGGTWQPVMLFAVQADGAAIARPILQAGDWPNDGPNDGPRDGSSLAVERDGLALLGNATPAALDLERADGQVQRLRLSATVHDAALAPSSQEGMVYGYLTPAALASLAGAQAEPFLLVRYADVDERAADDAAQRAADEAATRSVAWLRNQGRTVHEARVPAPGWHPHQRQAQGALVLFSGTALLAMALCAVAASVLLRGFLERHRPQLAVLSALGAPASSLAAAYALMLLALGLAAAVLGVALGFGGGEALALASARLLNLTLAPPQFPVADAALALLLCTALPLLAAAWPIAQATRTDVVRSLGRQELSRPDRLDRTVARWQRLPLSLRLALRSVVRRRRRQVLAMLLLAVAGAFLVGSLNLRASWSRLVDEAAAQRAYQLELRLVNAAEPARLSTWLAQQPEVRRAEPWVALPAMWHTGHAAPLSRTYPDRAHGQLGLRLLPTGEALLRPALAQGQWPSESQPGLAMNRSAAQLLPTGTRLGDLVQLEVEGRSVRARWIGLTLEAMAPATVYLPAAAWSPTNGPAAHWRLQLAPGADGAALVARLNAAGWPVARSVGEAALRRGAEGHVLVLVRSLASVALGLAFVGLVTLASTLAASVAERRGELALMQSLGAGQGLLAAGVALEAAITLVASWWLALPLAEGVTRWMAQRMAHTTGQPVQAHWSWEGVGLWLAASALCALLASLGPAWRAARTSLRQRLAEGM